MTNMTEMGFMRIHFINYHYSGRYFLGLHANGVQNRPIMSSEVRPTLGQRQSYLRWITKDDNSTLKRKNTLLNNLRLLSTGRWIWSENTDRSWRRNSNIPTLRRLSHLKYSRNLCLPPLQHWLNWFYRSRLKLFSLTSIMLSLSVSVFVKATAAAPLKGFRAKWPRDQKARVKLWICISRTCFGWLPWRS